MTRKNETLTQKLFLKESGEKTSKVSEILDYYSKVTDLVERTYVAMGKKSSFKVISSSTINEKLNTNVFSSTH